MIAIVLLVIGLVFPVADGSRTNGIGPEDRATPIDNGSLSSKVAVRITTGSASASLEHGCPPPGILACGSGVRLRSSLPAGDPDRQTIRIERTLATVLTRLGLPDLELEHSAGDIRRGRASSAGRLILRWGVSGHRLEVVTGDIELRPGVGLPGPSAQPVERAGPHPDLNLELDRDVLASVFH